MAKKTVAKKTNAEEQIGLLRTLLIVQLRLAGVAQKNIRDIVGCDINRVSEVIRLLPTRARAKKGDK